MPINYVWNEEKSEVDTGDFLLKNVVLKISQIL